MDTDIKKKIVDLVEDSELAERVEKVLKWKLIAKTDEEKAQADIALKILVEEVPSIKAAKKSVKVSKAIIFGLEVLKEAIKILK